MTTVRVSSTSGFLFSSCLSGSSSVLGISAVVLARAERMANEKNTIRMKAMSLEALAGGSANNLLPKLHSSVFLKMTH